MTPRNNEIENLVEQVFTTYISKCRGVKQQPEVNLDDMSRIVEKSRHAITEMLETRAVESKPFVAIRIDNRFSYVVQVETDNNVNMGVVEKAALLQMFKGDSEDVTQDNSPSGSKGPEDIEEMSI